MEQMVDTKISVAKIEIVTIEKRAWLDNQCKQFENNIKVSGLLYSIGDYYKKNASARREWRQEIVQRALVDTNAKNSNGKNELHRIVCDAHPLGNRDNDTIVIAFTESWVANDIKETIRKGGSNSFTRKITRNKTEIIKINAHHRW